MNFEIIGPIIIGIGGALLTGALPAYLTFLNTRKRLDNERDQRNDIINQKVTETASALIDATNAQLEEERKLHRETIELIQDKCETRIIEFEKLIEGVKKELLLLKEELTLAQEEIDGLILLVVDLYHGSRDLVEQLEGIGEEPIYTPPEELPDCVKEMLSIDK